MKAVTGSMAHTVEATKKARKNMYALIAYFGLPALMLTVTPIDLFCFRILICRYTDDGMENPPAANSETNILDDFVMDMRTIRRDFPGLCAIEFENVLRIVIRHVIGFDMNTQKMFQMKGCFHLKLMQRFPRLKNKDEVFYIHTFLSGLMDGESCMKIWETWILINVQ
jgi:hypothetical protein